MSINIQLETALCYQHYFCNTELRTAIITKIKGLSIQTQPNMFVLFKLTLDERKTLTKISTRKTSHNHSPNQHTLWTRRNKKTGKKQFAQLEEKPVLRSLHNWWRIRALGFHQETTEESRKQQDWFCIKLYIISYKISFILAVWF